MGHIYKRGNVYWIKYSRHGKPYYESSRSKKEADAKRLLKKREGEISDGKLPGIYFDKVKFDELAEDFLRDYRINNKKSCDRAERSVGHLKKVFKGMRVTSITTPIIETYKEDRMKWTCKKCKATFGTQDQCPSCSSDNFKKGAANATINRELSALKRMLNLGAQQTPPKVDWVPYISLLKENNVRKGFFEHGEFLALRNALPGYLKGFVTFGYRVGWRMSEITGLTWNQVDIDQGIVRLEVGETKNDDARTVYLDEELKEVFQKQHDVKKNSEIISPYVFPRKDGKGEINDFRKSWRNACTDAKIGKRLFHDFRRTAIRNMIRSGIPERVAMMISGHRTRSVFDRYNIVNDTDLRLAAQRQENYLNSQKVTILETVHEFRKKAI